jgi:RNA polymerase sigma factor (sigma-70 family)
VAKLVTIGQSGVVFLFFPDFLSVNCRNWVYQKGAASRQAARAVMDTQQLLVGLARGDKLAQAEFYREYAERIAQRARRMLWGLPPFASGTEVAQSVIGRFLIWSQQTGERLEGAERVSTREQLESLLQTMTLNRALNERRRALAKRRMPIRVVTDEELIRSDAFASRFGAAGVELAKACLRAGAQTTESCARLGLAKSDVDRELALIRAWLAAHREQPMRVVMQNDAWDGVHELAVLGQLVERRADPALAAIVQDCLEALDEKTRTIVVMRMLGGHTLEEIAERVELSVPTVRHRLKDVIDRWREQAE